jgi:L-threonylcarbamoyladenylate synthase
VPAALLDTREAAERLGAGGVLLLQTDTLPGFHCRADDPQAAGRIARIKGRSPDKPLLVLAADLHQAGLVLGSLDRRQRGFCRACWPGPFSLILPASAGMPREVTAGSGTVAVRVPEPESLRQLLRLVGFPLVSTSVNREGEPPALDLDAALDGFSDEVDGAWRAEDAPAGPGVSSALADLTVWPPRVLRPGPRPLPEAEK